MPTEPAYSLKLRTAGSGRTLEFRFEKPPGMTFKAGQFMDPTLIGPPERTPRKACAASPSTAPSDDPELRFTRAWRALAGGDLDAHSFRSLEKILKQRRNPRLTRKLNSEFGS